MESNDIRKALSKGRGIPALCIAVGMYLAVLGFVRLSERVLAHVSVALLRIPAAPDVFPLVLGLVFVGGAVFFLRRSHAHTRAGEQL